MTKDLGNNKMITLAKDYVFDLFKKQLNPQLIYHNFNHTAEVVSAAEEIALASNLPKAEMEILLLSALFHDTGYMTTYQGHEEESVRFALEFLQQHKFSETQMQSVASAIRATKYPQHPKNLLEEILCDADFNHFGHKDYLEKSNLLRLEWELMKQVPENNTWPETDICFLTEHKFYTEYAQRTYAKTKGRNIIKLHEIKDDKIKSNKKRKDQKEKEQIKKEVPDRGVETMFRVTFKNHMELSAIADSKANIMLSINAIIISISFSTLIPNFESNPALIYPSLLLLLVCMLSIIFATLSTRPKVSEGKFTREEVKQRKPNLLFFGNFHAMPFKDFEWGMKEMIQNKEF